VNSSASCLTEGYVLFDLLPKPHTDNLQDYPDYYTLIVSPIALAQIRKRMNSTVYKTVQAFKDDFTLMFNNARTYNQEGSWVYVDADEMEKVFKAAWDRAVVGSDLPGAPGAPGSASGSYASALTPMDEDDRPLPATSTKSRGARKQVLSDEEFSLPSDDD